MRHIASLFLVLSLMFSSDRRYLAFLTFLNISLTTESAYSAEVGNSLWYSWGVSCWQTFVFLQHIWKSAFLRFMKWQLKQAYLRSAVCTYEHLYINIYSFSGWFIERVEVRWLPQWTGYLPGWLHPLLRYVTNFFFTIQYTLLEISLQFHIMINTTYSLLLCVQTSGKVPEFLPRIIQFISTSVDL